MIVGGKGRRSDHRRFRGNDRLSGLIGDDVFVFRFGFGHDTVTDFSVGNIFSHDTLDLRNLGITSVSDLFNAASTEANYITDGPNAVIHVGGDDITLIGVTKSLLALNQFDILV